jgi:hypothetical protein
MIIKQEKLEIYYVQVAILDVSVVEDRLEVLLKYLNKHKEKLN